MGKGVRPDGHTAFHLLRFRQRHSVAVLKAVYYYGIDGFSLAVVIVYKSVCSVTGVILGQHKARMGSYLEVSIVAVEVLHFPDHLYRAAFQPIAYL